MLYTPKNISNNWGLCKAIEDEWQKWLQNHEAGGGRFALARIVNQKYHEYSCGTLNGEVSTAKIRGSLKNRLQKEEYPVVGDWVLVEEEASVHAKTRAQEQAQGETLRIVDLLPRRSGVYRWAAGNATRQQCIAANIDIVLLVFAIDGGRNFLSSFVERSLAAICDSNALPMIVVNKIDCAREQEISDALEDLGAIGENIPFFCVSAKFGSGIAALAEALPFGATIGMLGKSGVGKSALINALYNFNAEQRIHQTKNGKKSEHTENSDHKTEYAQVGAVKENKQGRHTTTVSQLYQLPWGAYIADVPGLRELKLWSSEDSMSETFPDIQALSTHCLYRNCSHRHEKGCAIQKALRAGQLSERRLNSYLKLLQETRDLEARKQKKEQKNEKRQRIARMNYNARKRGSMFHMDDE